jgi:phosphoserine phosphatase RsbU/P
MAVQAARLVVIDDTDIVRRVVVRQLEHLGFDVVQAGDGREGLEIIRSSKPDLVLCDLRMPRLDGLELLRLARDEFPDLPFIVVSGEGLLKDAIGALKLGAWDYITKPIEFAALEHAVNKALEKAALIEENRRYRTHLELLNRELQASLRLLADDEAAGRQIQFSLLPRERISFGDYQFTRDVVPSAFLSGDFIDAFWIDEQHFGFYLADVAGHGVSSALVTVLLRTYVQRQAASLARTGDTLVLSPARLLTGLNEEMARDALEKHLTIFYGVVNIEDDTLLYANAGHFPWPVLCDDHSVTVLERPSVPVGMVPGTRYEEHHLSLASKVSLAVFSDGVLEILPQASLQGKLEFLKSFFGRTDVSVEQARQELRFRDASSLPDDIALLIIQRGANHGDPANA